jgi:hypothetical protein
MRTGEWSFGRLAAHPALWAAVAIAGVLAWIMLPELSDADDDSAPAAVINPTPQSARPDPAAILTQAIMTSPAQSTAPDGTEPSAALATAPPEVAPPETRPEKSPLDGLRISSQSWRRGGLGSKALVTLTLRNANDYAVKDIEIACAFSRRDGSHLTDRKRVIGDTINMKTRKTYAALLVGFVNINANKAKCSLITASRI